MTAAARRPPIAQRRARRWSLHGCEQVDDYAWLRADNWREAMGDSDKLDTDIHAYLEAENAYTENVMRDTETLQAELFREMKGRIKEEDDSVPDRDGAYAYYFRYREGGQYPLHCRHPAQMPDVEEILMDGDAEAEGFEYFHVRGFRHSPDHRRFAWCVDDNGSEFYTLRVRDIESGRLEDEPIHRVQGDLAWAADGRHLFYTVFDDHHRPYQVRRHCLGEPIARDAVVYEESDSGFFVGVGRTRSGRFITIHAGDQRTTEAWLVPSDDPRAAPRLVQARERDVEYTVDEHEGRLLIVTNVDGAEDYKLVVADPGRPGRESWRDFYLPGGGVLLEKVVAFKRWIVRLEREEALPRLVVMEMDASGRCIGENKIAFDEECYELTPHATFEYDSDVLRFIYTSMTTPYRVFDYDMRRRTRELRKEEIVPSGHDPADYTTRRLFARAHDGERVPLSLLYRKTTPLDGSAPLLLYGYGSYGFSIPAYFSTNRLSLADRGFIFAIAHVRGGMEKGYHWYSGGRMENKRNTFLDFISCGEYLVREGYTRRGRIAAQGASAGGLLMGAVVNMRPELFAAAIAEVPFVDALNTMCDDTLPLTPIEWPEWGNPIEDAEAFRRIASWSPYDNVARRDYPHLFVTAGLSDPRVTYWEPAKWVAKLRACKTDDRLLLLKTNLSAGHGGSSGRFDYLEEVAEKYAFLLKVFDVAGLKS